MVGHAFLGHLSDLTIHPGGVDRRRFRVRELPEALVDALARHESEGSEGMTLEAFGEGRRFASSYEFLAEWERYEADTLSVYQSRNADFVAAANAREHEKKKLSVESDEYLSGVIPRELGHAVVVRRCRHGVQKKSRGKGKRRVKVSGFLECPARITGCAERDADGNWSFVTKNEFSYHNHKCTQGMLDSYGVSALLVHPEIAHHVSNMVQAGAASRNICDTVAANFGIVITPKQVANLRRARLGGLTAVESLRLLIQRYASFPGFRCLLIDDENGNLCAVVMQSAAQRAMFNLYGENVILDWTHNTNNLGFYLGSLMVTSVTGQGVSICDFLCIEQTEAMMSAVFEYFIETNPGATDKIVSFVIDKDYKEWRVLERLFVKSTVLLCQFHVAKWFAYVVTMRKYDMPIWTRERVLTVLSAMIYSKTTSTFDVLVSDLDRLLRDISPTFLEYMRARWYKCRRMWSNCERSSVFTATNTTSNRLESSWNQIKSFLGKKLRIDLCMEAVFAYQTAVLRREHAAVSKFQHSLILRSEVDRFMRSAMAEVSDYACDKVSKEWKLCQAHDCDSESPYVCWREGGDYLVTQDAAGAATYRVSEDLARCSCDFSVTAGLPCRHAINVARRELRCPEFPPQALNTRWRMKDAFHVLPMLKLSADNIQTLRTALVLSDAAFSRLIEPGFIPPTETTLRASNNIGYRSVKRFEVCDSVVLLDQDKRRVLESYFEPTIKFYEKLSTPEFLIMAAELQEVLASRLDAARSARSGPPVTTSVEDRVGESSSPAPPIPASATTDHPVTRSAGTDESMTSPSASKAAERSSPITRLLVGSLTFSSDLSSGCVSDMFAGFSDMEGDCGAGATNLTSRAPSPPVSPPSSLSACTDSSLLKQPMHIEARTAVPPEWLDPSPPVSPPSSLSTCAASDRTGCAKASLIQDASSQSSTHRRGFLRDKPGSSSETRAVMRRLADNVLTMDVPNAHAFSAAPPLKPVGAATAKTQKKRSSVPDREWLLSVLGEEYNPRDWDGDWDKDSEGDDTVVKRLTKRTLSSAPSRPASGVTKKQRVSGPSKKPDSKYSRMSSKCPIVLPDLNIALANTRGIHRIAELAEKYPCRMDEGWVAVLVGSATIETVRVADFQVNFRVTHSLLKTLKTALVELLDMMGPRRVLNIEDDALGTSERADLSALSSSDPVDLTGTRLVHPDAITTQAVVALDSSVRRFTKDNVSDFEAFFAVWKLCEAYKTDLEWLRQRERRESGHGIDIPYTHRVIMSRGMDQGDDPSCTAAKSVGAVMSSTTLNTVFSIRTPRRDLSMSIRVRDVVGYAAGSARLNDCVFMYALRQMAGDYGDVHVVDCLEAPPCNPLLSLAQTTYVVFPRNFSKVHWCIIVVGITAGSISHAWLYDPLQGTYESSLQTTWEKTCIPYLTTWATRCGVRQSSAVKPNVVRTNKQHDGDSCAVYCLGFAHDMFTASNFFTGSGCPSSVAIPQLRVRLLWRIFCDSVRTDNDEEERDARRTIVVVESMTPDPKVPAMTRNDLAKIRRAGSNWRS